MRTSVWRLRRLFLVLLGIFLATSPALPQNCPPQTIRPSLEPIAETKLLMEGLAYANFRGLERILSKKPTSIKSWKFARGQALLIAETANLLMLRPPKQTQGQAIWFQHSMKLRVAATELARAAANQDFNRSRALFVNLANRCNDCHSSFRVAQEVVPFANRGKARK